MALQAKKYNLVHICSGGEYQTPLVASQLFDQAECQAIHTEGFSPNKVEAWVLGSFGEYFKKASKDRISTLQKRCPHINIRFIGGISRLKRFPLFQLVKRYRSALGKNVPVIYHCRGEQAAITAAVFAKEFPGDKVVLDVRGYWPAESIYRFGIEYPEKAVGEYLAMYNNALAELKRSVAAADAVTTVSQALKDLLIKETGAAKDTCVVPCCVSKITDDSNRAQIRKEWGVSDEEIIVVYSGTTAAYQHLEDLTIPFMLQLARVDKRVKLAFFSSEHEIIRGMLQAKSADLSKIMVRGFPQKDVATALAACNVGILLRKPTLVNRVANPVKIAEYMAAGLPLIIERGVGGVDEMLFIKGLLKGITIAEDITQQLDAEVASVADWLGQGLANKRKAIRQYVKEVYLWDAAIQVSRKMYEHTLSK